MNRVEFEIDCFCGGVYGPQLVVVEDDGDHTITIRVWDSVAGHFTVHHELHKSAIFKITKLAKLVHAWGFNG